MKWKWKNKPTKLKNLFFCRVDMEYKKWNKIYQRLAEDLGINRYADETSSEIFDLLIGSYQKYYVDFDTLRNLIEGNTVFVFGAAPSLEEEIKKYKKNFENNTLIAADGATSALLKVNIIPDIIVSDLDGVIADQLSANKKNSILIIHAHGDNIDVVQKTIPMIKGPYLGTIQTNPDKYRFVKNFGGFTDGDRAVFLADFFYPKEIILIGFDCSANPGFYSFQKKNNYVLKMKKLQWCQRLLNLFPPDYVRNI